VSSFRKDHNCDCSTKHSWAATISVWVCHFWCWSSQGGSDKQVELLWWYWL